MCSLFDEYIILTFDPVSMDAYMGSSVQVLNHTNIHFKPLAVVEVLGGLAIISMIS